MKDREIINYILKDLFCALTDEDVITIVGQDVFMGGNKLDKKVVDKYSTEASKILNSPLFAPLTNKMKSEANKVMFEKSKNDDDMIFGKAMLHSINLLEGFLKKLKNLNIK